MSYWRSHIDTRLDSPTLPIALRIPQPSDGETFAALLTNPANGDNPNPNGKVMDAAWGEAAIGRMRDAASQPTIVSSDGRVESGPSKLNLVVVERLGPSEGRQQEDRVIGIGGYGAIKNWERDGLRVRAGDVGILLDGASRGKGYAVEAMRLAMDWGVTPVSDGGLQLDFVTITTLEDNQPMIRLVESKLGVGPGKGVLRPAEFDKDKQEMYFEIPAAQWKDC